MQEQHQILLLCHVKYDGLQYVFEYSVYLESFFNGYSLGTF